MGEKRRTVILTAAALFLMLTCPASWAVTTQPFTGEVWFADPVNPWGITPATPVFGSAAYDEGLLSGSGTEELYPAADPSFLLQVGIPPLTFLESQDVDFGSFPQLWFNDGVLEGIDFLVGFGGGAYEFDAFGDMFGIFDLTDPNHPEGMLLVEGALKLPIPEPASMLLVAGGLLGMLGTVSRKKG